MKLKLNDMLNNNHFKIDSSLYDWREPLSLAGLSAEDNRQQFVDDRFLNIGDIQPKSDASKIQNCQSFALHNVHNISVAGYLFFCVCVCVCVFCGLFVFCIFFSLFAFCANLRNTSAMKTHTKKTTK